MKLEIVRPPEVWLMYILCTNKCERPIGRERKILEILLFIIPKIALKMHSFGWNWKLFPPKCAFKNVYIMYWCERPIGCERKIFEILLYILAKIALKMRSFGMKIEIAPPPQAMFLGRRGKSPGSRSKWVGIPPWGLGVSDFGVLSCH